MITPRSFCPHCKTTLRWYDLIPILSYLFLKGKCRSCGAKISVRYPIIELICGGGFVFLFMMGGLTMSFVGDLAFFVLLIMVAIIDWEHLVIPDGIIIVGLVLGTAMNLFVSINATVTALGSAMLAGAMMFVIRWVGNAVFKKETMGMGDVKLSALIGLFTGIENFLIALWAAAVIGCLYWIVRHVLLGEPKDTKLPFGSFLSLASFVVLIMSNQIDGFIQWLIFQR